VANFHSLRYKIGGLLFIDVANVFNYIICRLSDHGCFKESSDWAPYLMASNDINWMTPSSGFI
jgi:hypothetical protein